MKTFIVVFLAALSAAVGEAFLSYGMRQGSRINLAEPSQWLILVLSVVRNHYVLIGVVFLGIFFYLYLAALSWADLSYVMPLTAMSYIFAALLARFVLKEDVTWFRWAGTGAIVIGIVLITLDGRQSTLERRAAGSACSPEVRSPGGGKAGGSFFGKGGEVR